MRFESTDFVVDERLPQQRLLFAGGLALSALELQRTRTFRLVNTDFAAPWKGQGSKLPPTLFTHVGDLHVLRSEISQGLRKVVAHEEKLVLIVLLGIMERGLKWWHGENQPAVAGINAGKQEHIAKKGPVRFGILGIDDDMRSIDQA